jgi:UDP-N-acetylmuramoylalanine--D-glutamate ligase
VSYGSYLELALYSFFNFTAKLLRGKKMKISGKKIFIFGLQKSGFSAARLCLTLGGEVFIYDDFESEDITAQKNRLMAEGAKNVDKNDRLKILAASDLLVLSPAVSLENDLIIAAESMKKTIISELELGSSVCKAPILAITGTNGKTTTASIVAHLLTIGGVGNFLCGNIGVPLADKALLLTRADYAVTEVSSFMLQKICGFKPKIAALLNISEDHLNRHKTMESYINTKLKIFQNQTKNDYAVLNYDDQICAATAKKIRADIFYFSKSRRVRGAYRQDGALYFEDKTRELICSADDIKIIGEHNVENVLCAIVFAKILGIRGDRIKQGVQSFAGVRHRLQLVRVLNGVGFYNDSKATNIDSTLKAVAGIKAPTVLILGGFDKGYDFNRLFQNLNENVLQCIFFGQTAPKLIDAARRCGYKNFAAASSLKDAVGRALKHCRDGYAVLLSPACASFDMFKDFEHRGEEFIKIVNGL